MSAQRSAFKGVQDCFPAPLLADGVCLPSTDIKIITCTWLALMKLTWAHPTSTVRLPLTAKCKIGENPRIRLQWCAFVYTNNLCSPYSTTATAPQASGLPVRCPQQQDDLQWGLVEHHCDSVLQTKADSRI